MDGKITNLTAELCREADKAGIDANPLRRLVYQADLESGKEAMLVVARLNEILNATPPPAENQPAKRGRKHESDPKEDNRIYDAWSTGEHKYYEEAARALAMKKLDVKRAIDRHRKRLASKPGSATE